MSAATAVRPTSRRSLERMRMTPEQELEQLIAEQERDDTYYVDRHVGEISLDAPSPSGSGTIGDFIGVDEEGEVVVFSAPRGALRRALGTGASSLCDPRSVKHGTIYGYRRQGCRCRKCKATQAASVADYRARRRAES